MKKQEKISSYQLAEHIGFLLRCIAATIEEESKHNAYRRWKEDEKGQLWYCGWQYSRDECDYEKDEILARYTDQLFVLADIVETPNYFEDNEKFYKKLSDVKDEIEGFEDLMSEVAIYEIMDDLKEFRRNEEDFDENGDPISDKDKDADEPENKEE